MCQELFGPSLVVRSSDRDGDLEDNLVRAAAKRANVDLVVTWDKGMLAKAVVPTVTPTDALAVMDAW